jgi:ankyrin repeat protein
MLLNAGADSNTRLAEGETVLMTAARTGKVEPVKLLLDRGADVNAKEAWRGQTALMWAAAEGNAAVVKTLIDRGAEINVRSNGEFTAFLFAARQGQIEAARVLLDAGANVNEKLRVEPPPARGSAPDAKPALVDGSSALMLAVASAHYELASMLLDRGADPNADNTGWAPIHQVSIARRPGQGENPLGPLGSGKMDSLDFVRKLVAKGADVNAQMKASLPSNYTRLGSKGATTFLIAARAGDTALMRTLVELGADPLKPNDEGTTPVLAAAGVGTRAPGEDSGSEAEMLEALKLALELGGNINDVDKNGDTVMHGAGYKHMPVVAQYDKTSDHRNRSRQSSVRNWPKPESRTRDSTCLSTVFRNYGKRI